MKWMRLSFLLMFCLPFSLSAADNAQGKRVLMVLTSQSEFLGTGKKTGFWFEELATPYYLLSDAGVEVTLASIKGGRPPVDPESEKDSTASVARFKADAEAMKKLARSLPLPRAKAEDYDAIFLSGGHGAMWDFIDNAQLKALLEAFIKAGKPIAALCHGPVALLEVQDEKGQEFLRGRKVTGFTRAEEEKAGLGQMVPHFLDAQLHVAKGKVSSAPPFKPHVVRDGILVTGQNPASSEGTAKVLVQMLEGK